jgi:Ni/Co efflux regulator RcnB
MKIRRWFASATTLLITLFLGVTLAKAQDQDNRDHHDQGSQDRDHQDRDHHDHDRFDDHDRQAARDWYRDHHDAFRHDEGRYWHQEWEPNIREGFVFTPEMRRAIRPAPRDLYGRLAPPPRGYRYVVIGDHVCLVDRGYRIHDVLHFELNF